MRLDVATLQLLEQLRRTSLLHVGGNAQQIRHLVQAEARRRGILQVGLPTPHRNPPGGAPPAAAPPPLPPYRSAPGAADPSHGEAR